MMHNPSFRRTLRDKQLTSTFLNVRFSKGRPAAKGTEETVLSSDSSPESSQYSFDSQKQPVVTEYNAHYGRSGFG